MLRPRPRFLFPAVILIAALAGCGPPPGVKPSQPPAAPPEGHALALLSEGRLGEAAQEYLRLSRTTSGPAAQKLRLKAVAVLIDAGEIQTARALLEESAAVPLAPALRPTRRLLEAHVALLEERGQDTLRLLPADSIAQLPPEVAPTFRRLRAAAYAQTGNHIEAAKERILLEKLLAAPEDIGANRRAIWESISKLTPAALRHARVPPPDELGGWIELAEIANVSVADPRAFSDALAGWRERFPGHSADEAIVATLLQTSTVEATPPRQIALLLPLQGRFKAAAEAVRDGFLAAWYADATNPERSAVRVHDTSSQEIDALVARAVAEGAEFVIGPLRKESVAVLACAQSHPIPILALNHANLDSLDQESVACRDGGVADDFYQFALSPEAEARLVAQRAWFDGHGKAITITPRGAWGERVLGAFAGEWERLGGVVVEHQTYDADAKDMSEPVAKALNTEASVRRARALKRVLRREVKHEPRRRQDVDFIFMAAFPRQARALRPQIKFHRASDVPVYATSHVFSGVVDSQRDRDIDGVMFGDMPWLLAAAGPDAGVRDAVADSWPENLAAFARLYAFGADAYRLIPQLKRLRARPHAEVPGYTGRLSVTPLNRIQRRLLWARFQGGVPRLLDDASALP